jgi:hypothetical protein
MQEDQLKEVAKEMAQKLFENLDDCKQKEDWIRIYADGIVAGYKLRKNEYMDDGK